MLCFSFLFFHIACIYFLLQNFSGHEIKIVVVVVVVVVVFL